MQTKIIIVVTDTDDEKHGEISVVDDVKRAERLVETLIEAGFGQERIRVFSGRELDIQVSQHPVVSLIKGEGEAEDSTEEGQEPEEDAGSAESGVRFSSLFRSG